jgi:hypothetical protein
VADVHVGQLRASAGERGPADADAARSWWTPAGWPWGQSSLIGVAPPPQVTVLDILG